MARSAVSGARRFPSPPARTIAKTLEARIRAAYWFAAGGAYDPLVGERRLEIRGRDLNPYGHVNSAVYATYLEECRNELIGRLLDGVG